MAPHHQKRLQQLRRSTCQHGTTTASTTSSSAPSQSRTSQLPPTSNTSAYQQPSWAMQTSSAQHKRYAHTPRTSSFRTSTHCLSSKHSAAVVQGSGKTLAFGLPIINFLVKEAQARAEEAADEPGAKPDSDTPEPSGTDARSSLRALILCPTRELALQVADHLSAIAKPLCIRVAAIVGGISVQKQARLLRYRPPIVVATPGRLWDLMRSGSQHVACLRHLAFLTLDEADRMVARGHYEELTHILSHIPKRREALLGKRRGAADPESRADGVVETHSGAAGDSVLTQQATLAGTLRTYVFSATLTLPDGVKARLQRGKGGSKGSSAGATLESLMETLDFRGKPKARPPHASIPLRSGHLAGRGACISPCMVDGTGCARPLCSACLDARGEQ